MRGTLQTLEKVGPHHADEKALTVCLIEPQLFFFVCQPFLCGCTNDIAGWAVDGQSELTYLVGQIPIGQFASYVGLWIDIIRCLLGREFADSVHFLGVKRLDLSLDRAMETPPSK